MPIRCVCLSFNTIITSTFIPCPSADLLGVSMLFRRILWNHVYIHGMTNNRIISSIICNFQYCHLSLICLDFSVLFCFFKWCNYKGQMKGLWCRIFRSIPISAWYDISWYYRVQFCLRYHITVTTSQWKLCVTGRLWGVTIGHRPVTWKAFLRH